MAIQKRNIRGLQDIPTLSGRVDQTSLPYKAYMKIACLEMEKARRCKERESASYRVKNIDARVGEIEDEKAALLQAQAELEKRRPTDARDSGPKAEPPPPRPAGPFKHRY
jgi:cytochrome c-type biogenesis protein CcmH/NrfG